ncbi:MAG TPA: aminotransferase class V-fold PLP-dependent enzyme [Thermoanaerobaculia bacterium]|nr:aminotransferase class V-fold PLP-dependent enzyme [Thermoanaerobaculia bacterium]
MKDMNGDRDDIHRSSFIVHRSSFRSLFPVTRNLIYFNHAAVGPLSVRAYEAMERHARDQREHGALHWRDWYAEYDRAREAAAKLIGAQPDEIAILKNTSEGISFVAEGLRWREGDNVITTAFEFASNWTPWKRLERRGVECRVAQLPTVAEIEKRIDDRTRVVTVSSVAFHNGFTADLNAIGELCASRNIRFFVDAIQSVGVLPIDVRAAKIDFLAADGHKWMCAAEGAALFYVAQERRDELEVLETGWTNVDRKGKFILCDVDLMPDARRFEAGSLNTNGIYGLRAALDLIHEIGSDVIREHALRVANALAEGLQSIGWTCVTGQPGNRAAAQPTSPIIGATPPNVEKSIRWFHGRLEEQGIVTAPREGLLRFSPHYYNDADEVARVLEVLSELSSSS